MRVWHSAWSWLNEMVAADSVAGKTFTGMLTRLTLRKPFQVGRAAIARVSKALYRRHRPRVCRGEAGSPCDKTRGSLFASFSSRYETQQNCPVAGGFRPAQSAGGGVS